MKKTNALNIALVDDHNLFRKGLIKLINLGDKEHKYNILFEADGGRSLQQQMTKPPFPDIILMDIDMQDLDGYEAVEWLKRTHPEIRVLVITMFEHEEAILRMLRLGVKGFLSKDIEVDDMHEALETISKNGFYYSEAASSVLKQKLSNQPQKDAAPILNEKEREFLKLAASDLTYQQIALEMHLSSKTIDGYREALFKRFNVKNRTTLVLYGLRHGFLQL